MVHSSALTTDDKTGHQHFSMERGEKADPQYIVFNGAKGSMLNDKAPHVEIGQSVRIFAGNAGPNLVSSFHVIGQIFDKVFREGDLISAPEQGVQTTLIPAGGSAVVEFTPRVPGTLLMVDHSIFRLHRGAAASLVVDGQKTAQTSELFNPVTAANGPEMSADAHLGGAPAAMPMNHAAMAGMNHDSAGGTNHAATAETTHHDAHAVPNSDALPPGGGSPISETIHTWGIPPASDDRAVATAMAQEIGRASRR